jgi:phenylalanyl-tRNA synthetase beta chain
MRVSLNWLQEYVDLPTRDQDELYRAFNMLGHHVEEIDHIRAEWTDVFVGKVLRIEAHPNADNVRVTYVDLGDGVEHQIICGAWNFETGAVVPVAIPGAVLPGDFAIGSRTIRGVESHGMICSERELGIGDLHEGIMVLEPDAPLGKPFESILDLPDVVFDLEITNNRPDAMAMVGIARELAAWFQVPMHYPDIAVETVPGRTSLEVSIEATDGCNRFVAREIDGVEIGSSPLWMRERLRRAGIRAISNIVDVTNYVMLELGHPLHAFDADRIEGQALEVRWATPGETLETLDGTERQLGGDDLVIVDAGGPTSLAAVMGGARSEVSDTTSRVIMEAASWHPATVMYTSRRHDLRSEASARFERGVDPNLAPAANARACRLLKQIGGGSVLEGGIDVVANPAVPVTIEIAGHEVQRFLGTEFDVERSATLLGRLLLDVSVNGDTLTVTVPTYRPDLTRPADLIEEIARLADYDEFGETVPTGAAGGLLPEQRRARLVHELLRGMGLIQVINLPFVSPNELVMFGESESGTATRVVTVRNPLRDDQSKLRQSLLPGLVRKLRENRNRGRAAVGLFETGRVFYAEPWPDDPRVPNQPVRLGVAVNGTWGGSGASEADAGTALAIVSALGDGLGLEMVRTADAAPGFHPTRTAAVLLDGRRLGFAGELHPAVVEAFEMDGRIAAVELDLDPLIAARPHVQLVPVSTFPHVEFDLSFEVDRAAPAGELVAATRAVSDLVETARIFDDYRDPDRDLRAVAIRYRLRAQDRTLDADEMAAVRDQMIEAAARCGARLRGS